MNYEVLGMNIEKLSSEFDIYIGEKYKAFINKFSKKVWDKDSYTLSLAISEDALSYIEVVYADSAVSMYIACDDEELFHEIKDHSNLIKNTYNIVAGSNAATLCFIENAGIDWSNRQSAESAFDWIVMNAGLLQDISDKYTHVVEEKAENLSEKIADWKAQKGKQQATDNDSDYETKKVYAETNNKTGIRYKIIHRKSANRYEIWTSDKNRERHRINNSEVEQLCEDKDAMIKYVKDNYL